MATNRLLLLFAICLEQLSERCVVFVSWKTSFISDGPFVFPHDAFFFFFYFGADKWMLDPVRLSIEPGNLMPETMTDREYWLSWWPSGTRGVSDYGFRVPRSRDKTLELKRTRTREQCSESGTNYILISYQTSLWWLAWSRVQGWDETGCAMFGSAWSEDGDGAGSRKPN